MTDRRYVTWWLLPVYLVLWDLLKDLIRLYLFQ